MDRDTPPRLRAAALVVVGLALAGGEGRAADPQPYRTVLTPTADAALDQAVHDASNLVGLRESAPVGPFALVGRARDDLQRFQAVLDSFGYYAGGVAITVAGRPLDDAGLIEMLEAAPAEPAVEVAVALTPGQAFHLGRITLPPGTPEVARRALGLASGEPARAADVLAGRARMQRALLDDGYALARVGEPAATLVPDAEALDVSFAVEAGPRVDLGAITISGNERLEESYIRRRLRLASGELFDPAAIEKARQDLAAVPALGSVRIVASDQLDADGRLPLRVEVSERALRVVTAGAAWSTDQGGSVSADWTHRNLFGRAETLTLGLAATQLGGTSSVRPGYNANAALTLPDWLRRGQSLGFSLLAVRESLQAYDRTAAIAGTTLTRKFGEALTLGGGLQYEQAQIIQEGVKRDYSLIQVPLIARYDTTSDPFEPVSGVRATLSLTPTESLGIGGTPGSSFVIAQATASTYLDVGHWLVGTEGRSILALRGLVGAVNGAGVFAIPPDQRFYAGGGGTVRGFRFQSIGPQFADGKPTGGNSVDVASVEFRQRFGASWGGAAFVDAGQVGTSGVPFAGAVSVGAGLGVRYYTPIGPIRIDVALPVTRQHKADAFEAYVGIGQAF